MSKEDFIKDKLSLMQKDNQNGFNDFVEPLQSMVEKNEASKIIQIPADGNWFKLSFKAVEVKHNRLVISAKRIENGLITSSHDPSLKEYAVEFSGTRAAYLFIWVLQASSSCWWLAIHHLGYKSICK